MNILCSDLGNRRRQNFSPPDQSASGRAPQIGALISRRSTPSHSWWWDKSDIPGGADAHVNRAPERAGQGRAHARPEGLALTGAGKGARSLDDGAM